MPAAKGPFDVGGVPIGGVVPPPAATRRGGGRLGRKLRSAGKKANAPVSKRQPSAKSLARWENEGGTPPPRTTPDRGKVVQAAHATKKSATTQSMKKSKPKAGTPKAKARR